MNHYQLSLMVLGNEPGPKTKFFAPDIETAKIIAEVCRIFLIDICKKTNTRPWGLQLEEIPEGAVSLFMREDFNVDKRFLWG